MNEKMRNEEERSLPSSTDEPATRWCVTAGSPTQAEIWCDQGEGMVVLEWQRYGVIGVRK